MRELEKKFSGRHVVFCAERKILPKPRRGRPDPNKQKRPRSRTLTAVYDNILDDLVFPAEIVGKRIRVKLDGSQLIKVHLDKNQQTTIEHKVSNRIKSKVNVLVLLVESPSIDQWASSRTYIEFCVSAFSKFFNPLKVQNFYNSRNISPFLCSPVNFTYTIFLIIFQVDTFTAVYKKLTGRDVTFEFPEPYL